MGGGQVLGDVGGGGGAGGMSPAAGGLVVGDVVDDVVVFGGADAAGDVVEFQGMAEFPGDVMVSTGTVTTDTQSAEEFAGVVIDG